MPICTLTTKDSQENWCEHHRMYHRGHYAAYALDPGEKGQKFRAYWDKPKQPNKPMPHTATQMVAEYAATLAKHIAGGRKAVSDETYQERRKICDNCQHRNTELDACRICKCKLSPSVIEATVLGDKLRWAVSKCPVDKWHPESSETPRHLLFHLWPKKTSLGTWQRNLDQLKQRWSLFTGKRVIAVATSLDSHNLEAVQSYMQGYDCEWVHIENDSKLREVKTFLPLFERVEGLPGYTFYGQGKGVTKPINAGVTIHSWTSAMFETLLDYWPIVEDLLKRHPVVGSFKKGVAGFGGSRSLWHYSGSFCWFNNAQLFSRNWRDIEQVWFGIESYPSMLFTVQEAGTVFFERSSRFNLYSLRFWKQVEQELQRWRQEKESHRTSTGLLTTTGQP